MFIKNKSINNMLNMIIYKYKVDRKENANNG